MDIKKLSKQIHAQNVKKGFWDKKRNEGEVLFLIITELAEMCEADREGRIGYIKQYEDSINRSKKFKYSPKHKTSIKRDFFEKYVKDSMGDELADAFIRMCDYCAGFKRDINEKSIKNISTGFIQHRIFENLGEELLIISHLITLSDDNNQDNSNLIFSYMIWLSHKLNIPLEKHVKLKMWYNSTRPKMHNKKY